MEMRVSMTMMNEISMGKKFKKYEKKKFESTGTSSDTSSNIYESMLLSAAWLSLSATQQVLYITCKSQYYSEKQKPNGNREQFTMNKYKWLTKYQLYTNSNSAGFYRDMGELINKGFIKCVYCGANSRTKSIYQYSDKWQLYGTDSFFIPNKDKTISMLGWKKSNTPHRADLEKDCEQNI